MSEPPCNSSAQNSAPFEGAEKLLEIWFAPSAEEVPDAYTSDCGRNGLRKIDPSVWEDMLDIVRCKVLSLVRGKEIDAYLLSESSLFIFPHRIILKTCGTTLNLLGLPRILEIASAQANMPSVYRCFYSRKSFMFPERQQGPHRDWKYEIEFLDNIFSNGAAYTVGKVNGDHWLLYITGPANSSIPSSPEIPASSLSEHPSSDVAVPVASLPDYTIEILMSDLSPAAREPFFSCPSESNAKSPSTLAESLSSAVGIANIFPPHLTTLDAYAFSPCGYSSNALIRWADDPTFIPLLSCIPRRSCRADGISQSSGEGYYTIHVTPEEGWSYASFECNVPLPIWTGRSVDASEIPDLRTLIERVVRVFQPGRLSVTLFISSQDNETDSDGDSTIESAQRIFKLALTGPGPANGDDASLKRKKNWYRRTDKINYEFGGYDLAFASFEKIPP